MEFLRLVGSSLRPEKRGVAEVLVKILKARGRKIEAFILMTSYEAGVLVRLIVWSFMLHRKFSILTVKPCIGDNQSMSSH